MTSEPHMDNLNITDSLFIVCLVGVFRYSAYKFFSKMSLRARGNAVFLSDCLAFPKPESKKRDDLGDPRAQMSTHFAIQICIVASMCPRSGPK